MALPQDFDPWEHLQDVVRKVFKKEVVDEFRDIGNDDWDADITTGRGSLRTACLPDDNDTATMLVIRMMLFYITLRRAQDMQAPLIGMPYWDMASSRSHKPQVILYFSQDRGELKPGQDRPVTARIGFRLMDESSTTITNAKLKAIATRIKTTFGKATESKWYRGRNMANYTDWENGLQLQLLTDTKANAIDVIKSVLYCAGVLFDSDKLNYTTNDNPGGKYPAVPGNQSILGISYKKPVIRRVCVVRFRYATAIIHGRPTPIPLYDESGKYIAPLVDQF